MVEQEDDDFDEVQLHYDEFYGSTEDSAYQVEHVPNRVNIDASPVLQWIFEADSLWMSSVFPTDVPGHRDFEFRPERWWEMQGCK